MKDTATSDTAPIIARMHKFLLSDVNALRYVGTIPDKTPDELWPEEELLTLTETLQALRVNRLRRLYLEYQMFEIMQCSELELEQEEEFYIEFMVYLTECIELLGIEYVCEMLEPLGFRHEHFFSTKRSR